ncbi:YojF family protein [Bacillus alkalicellulosilyticus]|uniref:YojF family protein n=1 Tax=Alkalihalobacterium alkalicellulosilyticum TaxID=1912214 RepID=UPI000997DAC1|nr:YojF family protein [Bacillus alkalicellulosilyticus]
MEIIRKETVQSWLEKHTSTELYLHLETTNGAYTAYRNGTTASAGVFIRNGLVTYEIGKITGAGPYRVGLKIPLGWVYADGVTHFEIDQQNRLLLAGLDENGKLAVALQLSDSPFE